MDHVRYALIRNVVGPMDYTPLVFDLPYRQQKISYAHSLALSVVFESGLQHLRTTLTKLKRLSLDFLKVASGSGTDSKHAFSVG